MPKVSDSHNSFVLIIDFVFNLNHKILEIENSLDWCKKFNAHNSSMSKACYVGQHYSKSDFEKLFNVLTKLIARSIHISIIDNIIEWWLIAQEECGWQDD